MIQYWILGMVLGLSAGFAPGPLLTLVVAETLRHDVKSGVKVAVAPLLTDLPIIALTLFVLSGLSRFHAVLGLFSLVGGGVVLFMGHGCLATKGLDVARESAPPNSLRKAVWVNFLSPHPYLFWLGVGAPTMTKALEKGPAAPAAFLMGFYLCLVGAKVLAAVLTGKSKSFISGKVYVFVMRFLGAVLVVLALALFREGLRLLGVI